MSTTHIHKRELIFSCIMGLFTVLTVLSNTVGVKIFSISGFNLPVSVLWFPFTFLITDIVSEVFGKRHAYYLVVMGFLMNVLLLIVVLAGINLPSASFYALDQEYLKVYSPTWRLLFASMSAYLLAQSIDVKIFHFLKKRFKGKHLWLRNNASTMISQFIDTVTVSFIFLYNNPSVFTGNYTDLWVLIAHLYSIKVLIAFLDTPLCYLGVNILKKAIK